MNKVDYVLRNQSGAARDPRHTCHWPGCTEIVAPAVWGCRRHWYQLPKVLRHKVWAAFRPGQEISKTPSTEYLKVAREVQEWINQHQRGKR